MKRSRGLASKTFGEPLYRYDVCTSTQDLARDFALEGAPDGTAVVANLQTAGRGRMGRQWLSPKGKGIHLSVVLRPKNRSELKDWSRCVSRLPLVTAVAVVHAIRQMTGLLARVKWVNDVLLEGRKVCGILVETAFDHENRPFAIVGVGVNVTLKRDDFPRELRATATSLHLASGQQVDRERVLQVLLDELDTTYKRFRQGKWQEILAEYKASSALLGERVTVRWAGGGCVGVVEEIDDSGALALRDDAGNRRVIAAGDVTVRKGGG